MCICVFLYVCVQHESGRGTVVVVDDMCVCVRVCACVRVCVCD